MQSTEVWKSIPEHEGMYEVSDHGNVRSLDRVIVKSDGVVMRLSGKMLKPYPHPQGYLQVRLQRRQWKVHQLVLLAFVGPLPAGQLVRHRNDVPDDNRLSNLTYGTHAENARDAVTNGRNYRTKKSHCLRGHLLTAPNLIPSGLKDGMRMCLACGRARTSARDRGIAMSQEMADRHYAKIMEVSDKWTSSTPPFGSR